VLTLTNNNIYTASNEVPAMLVGLINDHAGARIFSFNIQQFLYSTIFLPNQAVICVDKRADID